MDLANENFDIKRIYEFLKLKEKFVSNDNIDVGYYILMQDIISFFDVDRIYIGMKSADKNQCVPIVEYLKGQEPNFLCGVIDFNKFTKFVDVNTSEAEQEYIDMCKDDNYFLGDDFNKLSNILPSLGYVPSDKGNPRECLIFYIKNDISFSLMLVERYEEKSKNFTQLEIDILKDIHRALGSKIREGTLEERLKNETGIKDIIIKNEQIPICLIEKSESKVIYYNDSYKNIMPKVDIGVLYYNMFDKYDTYELLENSKSLVLKNYGNDNIKYWIRKVLPMTLADGTNVYMVYIRDTDDCIEELEGIDLLTSAYSLSGFNTEFKNFIGKNKANDYMLCTIDISKFKYVNSTYGFDTGNTILKKIVSVINKFIRKQEIFCRINEDRFAMLLQASCNEEVKARINKLFEQLENMKKDYFFDIKLVYMCGVTNVDTDVELNILIDRANNARKSVKDSHKNVIAFFDEETEKRIKEELLIESKITKAVENGEFVPYLQPKFDLETMKICGAEALVRWITPTGMIFPDSFIPLFEKNGFIDTLDFIIYQKVMEHIRNCLDRGLTVYPISLNVSRNHIKNENFVTQIMELINKYKVPIDLIELEITESVFVEDREILKLFIDNIKRPKIKVSIDDFGTAYSSLQVLKDVEIDILKIDKGFLDNIDFSNNHAFTKDEVVLKNIINLARDLGCKVICEGIETEEQVKLLKNIGCEYGQGYLFSKPIPIEDYENKFLDK